MRDEAKDGGTQDHREGPHAWPRDLGFILKVLVKNTFLQLGIDPVRLNLRKLIPFQCGQDMPGSLGEDKSRGSDSTDIT